MSFETVDLGGLRFAHKSEAEPRCYVHECLIGPAEDATPKVFAVLLDDTGQGWRVDDIENPRWGAAGRVAVYGNPKSGDRVSYWDDRDAAVEALRGHIEELRKTRERRAW